MTEQLITITKSEFDALQEASKILDALYAGGVDNWEWFGESLSAMEDTE